MNLMRLPGALTTVFLVAAVLPAQQGGTEPPKPKSTTETQDKLAQKVQAQRDAMRAGKVRNYNVYVRVRLKNGNRMKGVVKNGRFVERRDGLDFEPSQRSVPGSGLRVWFTAGTNSFIFMPYDSIANYRIGRTLSDDQVKAIELTIAQKRREIEEQHRLAKQQAIDKQKAEADKATDDPGKGGRDGATAAGPQLSDAQKELLKEFPPDAGWGESKIASLKLRRITLGVYPSEKEKRFEENYKLWSEAYTLVQQQQAAERQAARDQAQKALVQKSGSGDKDPGGKNGKQGEAATPPSGTPPKPGGGAPPPMPNGK
jgi:hypothetical protein